MKARPRYFLDEKALDHQGQAFSYIRELHGYLWRLVHIVYPGASGSLDEYLDSAIEKLETIVEGDV